MEITAIHNVQVEGYGIVRRGATIDLDEAYVDKRIADNFRKADGSPIVLAGGKKAAQEKTRTPPVDDGSAAIERAVKVIGRDGIMRKLDELGITYRPTHKTDYLARLLLDAQGEI